MPAKQRCWHFGVLSFTGTGHVLPLIALSKELKRRGHKVTFFEKRKIQERVRQAGLDFISIGAKNPAEQDEPPSHSSGIRSELATLCFNLARVLHDMEYYLDETPLALARAGVDALLINEIAITGPTVAQMLRLPYFLISTSVPHHFGWKSSSWLTGYRYSASALSWMQSAFLEVSALRVRGPIKRALNEFRWRQGLGPVDEIPKDFPCLAHITQLPLCLDLPHMPLSSNFHYAGPFADRAARPAVDFPWDRIDGRPLIYASMGTTRNVQPHVFRMIAEACNDLNVQLVISMGNRFEPERLRNLPGRPIVVRYAPQLELLKVAQLVITHGGSNTVFETLMEGKPMIVIPLAYDQPAIATRLARAQVAEVLPVMRLSPKRIRNAVTQILSTPRYSRAAKTMQARISATRGSERAADLIEAALAGICMPSELKYAHTG
jgi:zeaxanthin glucosyltransferase